MAPAMAAWSSPAGPASIAVARSTPSIPVRMHVEVSTLSGPAASAIPVMKMRNRVSLLHAAEQLGLFFGGRLLRRGEDLHEATQFRHSRETGQLGLRQLPRDGHRVVQAQRRYRPHSSVLLRLLRHGRGLRRGSWLGCRRRLGRGSRLGCGCRLRRGGRRWGRRGCGLRLAACQEGHHCNHRCDADQSRYHLLSPSSASLHRAMIHLLLTVWHALSRAGT